MIIVGLTGSIGMGKSTVGQMLGRWHIPVFDADGAVHRLYARGGAAVAPIEARWPMVIVDGAVDRLALSKAIQQDPAALKEIEAIVHPLVQAARQRFLLSHALRRTPLVVLDIPLLFETGYQRFCDYSLTVYCADRIQQARVMARPHMTPEKFHFIKTNQMPTAEKLKRSDYALVTDQGKRKTHDLLAAMIADIKNHTGPTLWQAGYGRLK